MPDNVVVATGAPFTFSPREVAELARVDVKTVEKAVDDKIIPVFRVGGGRGRRRLSANAVLFLHTTRQIDLRLPLSKRRKIYEWLNSVGPVVKKEDSPELALSDALIIKPTGLFESWQKITAYQEGRDRFIHEDPAIMGGTPVIKGTRITVYSVLGRVSDGDSIDLLMDENPNVPREAFEVAITFARSHPLVGRPGGKPWRNVA